ncbi:COP1-interactive protein 1-like [Phoenix dactylifera]|uniref:COP1-interactive protein 1-like n=1 Tax=Phoenix dactylifera TaxID=42345 RepID=A0A8B8J1P9_PHODC|nr:COP1-interactive protein 1-like [Phoenix dactylifera]XP_038985063.1 COP1-interactive protein 1-like [Phoenix dactylifera]
MANVGTRGKKAISRSVQTDANQGGEEAVILDAVATGVFSTQEKLNLDEKQAVDESATTEDASVLQVKPDGLGLATETQKEEVANAEVVKEDCQVLQNQPELEDSGTGEGDNVDKSTHRNSEDEKQVMNESIADDASTLQAKTDGLGLTTENQKENVADMEQKCATEISKKDDTVLEPVDGGHGASLMASILESAMSQEGTMQTQLSSSEKLGDITVEIEKQQNDEQIISYLRSEVECRKAANSQLRFEAAEVSRRFGDAKMNLERLKKILKDKDLAQDWMSSATVAHALRNQTATKDAEEPGQQSKGLEKKLSLAQQVQIRTQKQTSDMPSEIKAKEAENSNLSCKSSNIKKEMDAEIKYLVAKINKQNQEIDSLSKNNDELLEQYEAEKAKNEKIENLLNEYKEKMIKDQNILSEANCDMHKALTLMEEQQSMMKCVAESMVAAISDELQTLETVFEEHCELILWQLSNCTKEIQMEKQKALPLLRGYKRTMNQNDVLISTFLSTDITNMVLRETNWAMDERLEEDGRLLERHLNSQHDLEKLKNKVETREKELEARNEEMQEDIRQMKNAVDYYRERYHRLYTKYHPRERLPT